MHSISLPSTCVFRSSSGPSSAGAHYIFDRAYNSYSSLYTLNNIGAFFVFRAKFNVKMKVRTWTRRLPEGMVSDIKGSISVYKSSREYPEELRKVIVLDPDEGTRYIFLTNNMEASPLLISELYRNRWSVELFFKWVKQHPRIKKFWGISEDAVHIQIYCAIITYCLIAVAQHDMKLERSIYDVLQILGISQTDKTHLRDLFDKSNFKNVNVFYSSEPNLFSFLEWTSLVDAHDLEFEI